MKAATYFLITVIIILNVGCSPKENESLILFVRHAEKDTLDQTDNPPLTEEGILRSHKLKAFMLEKNILPTAIYSTKYVRNMNTVNPIAKHFNISIEKYEWYNWQEMVSALKNAGETVLICGHGDNIIPMIEALNGKPPIQELGDYEYDKIFSVHMKKDTSVVEMFSY